MCLDCYLKAGTPHIINDNVIRVAQALKNLDDYGYAHIIVSDWNLEDENIDFCMNECRKYNDNITYNVLFKLKILSIEERYTAMALRDDFITETESFFANE